MLPIKAHAGLQTPSVSVYHGTYSTEAHLVPYLKLTPGPGLLFLQLPSFLEAGSSYGLSFASAILLSLSCYALSPSLAILPSHCSPLSPASMALAISGLLLSLSAPDSARGLWFYPLYSAVLSAVSQVSEQNRLGKTFSPDQQHP